LNNNLPFPYGNIEPKDTILPMWIMKTKCGCANAFDVKENWKNTFAFSNL
jgi:hypothetical protein